MSSGESRTALTASASRSELSATGLMSAKRVGTGGDPASAGRDSVEVSPSAGGSGTVVGAGEVSAEGSADRVSATSPCVGSVSGASGASASEVSSMSTPESLIWTVVVSSPR